MYKDQTSIATFGSEDYTENICNGIKQGGVQSPTIFNLHIENAINKIKTTCYGGVRIRILAIIVEK